MSRLSLLLSTVLSGMVLLGCAEPSPQEPESKTHINVETNQTNRAEDTADGAIEQRVQEVYWKLIGVEGKAVIGNAQGREAYIILKLEGNRLQGFGGCNILLGSYTLNENEHHVRFSRVASTMMACPRLADESEFLKALEKANHYSIDAGVLSLQQEGKTVATFEASYQP